MSLEKPKRPFLKWAGGKLRLIEFLAPHFPPTHLYLEPFLGAGAVFLNTQHNKSILNDINPDLMALYQFIQKDIETVISEGRLLFSEKTNKPSTYYRLRATFNQSQCPQKRALLFLYLNRHGYNGLCRYNLKGKLNVPFGHYKAPYFPEKELRFFHEKLKKASLFTSDYQNIIQKAPKNSVVYCDPPYVPISQTARFTQYSGSVFSLDNQAELAELAQKSAKKGAHIFISNHDLPITRELYQKATQIHELWVRRSISCTLNNRRAPVKELLAYFGPLTTTPQVR